MPTDLFQRGLNLDLVYPPFLERLLELKVRCRAKGSDYLSTCLLRSVEDSDAGYAKFMAGTGPRFAPGGSSSHNFGLASDEALVIKPPPKRVVRWGDKDFDLLGREALKLGLHWGINYGDKPHISWPGFVSAHELTPLLAIWLAHEELSLSDRLVKVWDHVTEHTPPLPQL